MTVQGVNAKAQAVPVALAILHKQGSFQIDLQWQGECRLLGLFGPSGSGKSSVLEIVAGLRRPDTARIVVGDVTLVDTAHGASVPVRLRRIGYVPQEAALFPHLTVRGNVTYGSVNGDSAAVGPVLDMLDIGSLIDRSVGDLSGGERQRVALARALLSAPALLLLDEPLSAVDVPLRRKILKSLGRWMEAAGVPAIHVSHDAGDLAVAADHVLRLAEGRLVGEGPAVRLSDDVLAAG